MSTIFRQYNFLRLWLAIYLLTTGIFLHASPAGWQSAVQCRREEGNVEFSMPWGGAGKASVLVVQRGTDRTIRLDLTSNAWKATEMLPGGYEKKLSALRFFAPATPEQEHASLPLTIKFREDEWSLYVDGTLRGVMAAPFALPAEIFWPQRPQAALTKPMRFRPVPRAAYTTDFMIEEGAPNELYPWTIQLGSWGIHTAQQAAVQRPETDQKRAKEAPLVPDKSPNFYSLKGGGQDEDAIITTGYDYFDNYQLTGSVRMTSGVAGIIFYHRDEATTVTAKEDNDQTTATDPTKANFYALTLHKSDSDPEQNEIRLWKQQQGQRTPLARAKVALHDNQWYQPGVQVHGHEIVCLLDGFEVCRVTELLPVGGKIGLYANTPTGIFFDDINLQPYTEFLFQKPELMRYNTLHSTGSLEKALQIAEANGNGSPLTLRAGANRVDAELVLGRTHSRNMVFEVEMQPHGRKWAVGLIAGWEKDNLPHYQFQLERIDQQTVISRLVRVTGENNQEILEECQLPANIRPDNEQFKMMTDASEGGFLRCRLNGMLVHLWPIKDELRGAAGVWQRADTRAIYKNFNLAAHRQVYRDQEQKNPIFQADSFMRHWASPEGQWVNGGKNLLWHKGDFFGDFAIALPAVENGELHLAVPDGGEEGSVQIKVLAGNLICTVKGPGQEEATSQSVALPQVNGKPSPYIIHHEGTIVWIETNSEVLLQQRLDFQLKLTGTRVLAKNYNLSHMAESKVTRDNIIDEFFNESPYMWIANGGDWQIINRFQCTPSWSHMIGEAPEGMGAFWRKQIFSGDMTLEFYAGTRHGYYDDAGNLNCTIMADQTSPGRGYTIACTEWDQNLSQNWTTFYKNGQAIAKTDAYLVPRRRKGMYRRILNPLVSEGRPIHGAWFYLKLRKIGDKLEYSFDDEVIFTETDPEAIKEGLVGIWTFAHSMTLAQIKITFEKVRPRPFAVTTLPLPEATADAAAVVDDSPVPAALPEAAEASAPETAGTTTADAPSATATPSLRPEHLWTTTVNNFPLDSLASHRWSINDSVGQSHLQFFPLNSSALLLRNQLGAGMMRLQASLPATPLVETAGWQVKIKRTDGARFNFFYSTGSQDGNGTYRQNDKFFHHLTGADFTDSPDWQRAGSSKIPAAAGDINPDRHDWTTVTIWIPSSLRRPDDAKQKRMVRVDGFGIEQLDAIANGIQGNHPGDAYAISELVPIFYGRQTIEAGQDETCYVRSNRDKPRPPADMPIQEQWQAWLIEDGLNHAWITARQERQTLLQKLAWVQLPEKMPLQLSWDSNSGDAILLRHAAEYVDPRFATVTISCLDEELTLIRNDQEEVIKAFLPKTETMQKAMADGKLTFKVRSSADSVQEVSLQINAAERQNAPPTLLAVDGFSPLIMTFERGEQKPLQFSRQRMAFLSGDAQQGSYLQVKNTAMSQALETPFSMDFSVANYPLVQFRYRAWDMAQISLSFRNGHHVRLAPDDTAAAMQVRHGHDLIFDEQWRSWTGMVSDAFVTQPFSIARFAPNSFKIASAGSPDQTGRYSRYHLDDLVFGPAVRSATQLSCTPQYYDADGIEAVFSALLHGPATAHERQQEEIDALAWTKHEPGQSITPSLEGLQEGVWHLLLKAVDRLGAESAITDLPFLLDTKPLQPNFSVIASNHPHHNGIQLKVDFDNAGASPWNVEKAKFYVAGEEISMPQWTNVFSHSATSDQLFLNHPFLFRNHFNKAQDGDVFNFAIDQIADGAGNTSERLTIPLKVDYASDKTGPSWYSLTFPSSVNWYVNWDGYRSSNAQLTQGRHNRLEVINNVGRSPFLSHGSYYSQGDLSQAVAWQPSRHPYLSFRLANLNVRGEVSLQVVLTTTADRKYIISLTKPGSGSSALNRDRTFTWVDGQWQRLSFNVEKSLLQAGVSKEALKNLTFKSIDFQRRGCKHNDTIYLDDLFIHGDTTDGKPDLFKWTAFDASGVASLEATAVDDLNKDLWSHSYPLQEPTDLNVLRAKINGLQWFRCQAKDKAGNLSVPFWMPLYAAETAQAE